MIEPSLGHYKVESRLGAGGMGVVYEATDTRLGRRVAIKVLHEPALGDRERLARFEREAKLLASLNHANIAAIYGLEEVGDLKFLVLEYVAGETLADRLARGAIPVREALEIALQIAEALEVAHQSGIIHRDLKPANIKVTPDGLVKVLDFGLAKALDPGGAGHGEPTASTVTELTRQGIVMGTVPYMSPEQVGGRPLDQRTDIWAFGCVLYEMLSGTRTFAGDSTTEILVGILDRDPDWSALAPTIPENIRRLLRRCLAKGLRNRLHHAADVRLELADALTGGLSGPVVTPTRRYAGRRVFTGLAAALTVVGLVLAAWLWRRPASLPDPRVIRFDIELSETDRLYASWGSGGITFSPDSEVLLYPSRTGSLVRRLDASNAAAVEAVERMWDPVYSPDGRWFLAGYPRKGVFLKVPLTGGAPVPIAPVDIPFGAAWGTDGYVYVANRALGGIVRVLADGGEIEPLTQIDDGRQERSHRYPTLLPQSRALLLTVATGEMDSYDDARIDVVDLDRGTRKPVVQGGTYPRYSPSGHIVYARGGGLYAVFFDPRTLEVSGTPVKVLDGVLMSASNGQAYFDISPAGDLAYALGPAENRERTLHWVDRQGRSTPLPLPGRPYLNPRISPDGRLLAVEIEGPNHDFYVYDFDRDVMSRISNDGGSHAPIWTPDGRRIAYRTSASGAMTMSWMPADRSGPEERLVDYTAWQSAVSFSPDGRYLAFDQYDPTLWALGSDIWVLPLEGDRQPRPLVKTSSPEGAAKFSPDGRWLVYSSEESGRAEVYVQAWPGPGAKTQISSEGGTDPVWRRDGKEIFYRNESKMMAVPIDSGATFRPGRPQMLWSADFMHGLSSSCGWPGVSRTSYDVSLDGERFLMIQDSNSHLYATKIAVVLNWTEELKRLMREAGKLM